MGTRLMIIELTKYIEFGELLIGNGTTVLQVQVIYQDRDWMASVAREAVCMGLEGTGMRTGYRGAYKQGPRWE